MNHTDHSPWTLSWLEELRKRIEELGCERSWICEQQLGELDDLKLRLLQVEKRLKVAVTEAPGSSRLLAQKASA